MNPMQAAIQAGYSESTARTHVYSWPKTAEARAEILQALNGVGIDQHFLAKHLKRRIAKGDVRAMALAGRWRGYDRAWALEPGPPRQVLKGIAQVNGGAVNHPRCRGRRG